MHKTSDGSEAKKSSRIKLVILFLVIATLLGLSILLPLGEYVQKLMVYLQEIGPIGLVILAVLYVFACVLLVPGSILTLGAGFLAAAAWPENFLLALLLATITVSVGSVTGATLAFILGRTFARSWIESRIAGNAKFRALDEAIAQQGLKMVFLVRLSPALPFNIVNYALGLTRVRLRDYVLASWIGMLPGTVMYVYFGMGVQSVTALAGTAPEGGTGKLIFQAVGLVATIAIVVLITRIAKKSFDEAVNTHSEIEDNQNLDDAQ